MDVQDIYGIGKCLLARLIPQNQVVVVQPRQGVGPAIYRKVHRDDGVPEIGFELIRYLAQGHEQCAGRAERVKEDVLEGHAVDAPVHVRNKLRHNR